MRTTPKKVKALDGDVTEQEIKTRNLWPISDLASRLDVSAEAIRKRVIRHSMKVMRQGRDGSMIFDHRTAWTLAQYFNARRSRTPSFDFDINTGKDVETEEVSYVVQLEQDVKLISVRADNWNEFLAKLDKLVRDEHSLPVIILRGGYQ